MSSTELLDVEINEQIEEDINDYLYYKKLFISQIKNHVKVANSDDNTNNNELIIRFTYLSRPISKVEIVGVIRSIEKRKRLTVICDDGTACILCVKILDSLENSIVTMAVGDTVLIQGNIAKFETNETPYDYGLKINKIEVINEANVELYHWTRTMYLHSKEYNKAIINMSQSR